MRLSKKNRLLIFVCATVALLFYQNCSENFKSGQTSSLASEDSTSTNDSTAAPGTATPTEPSAPTTPVTPSNKMVNVFMAAGHMARTVFSCDDGKTWIHDISQNDATRCWVTGDPNYVECDHTPYSGRGIDSGDGWFFVNFGWGSNGSIRRSRDGVNWQTLRTDGWGGGVAYSKGMLLLLWKGGLLSGDLGTTWQSYTNPPMRGFDHPSVTRLNDKFVLIGRSSGTNKIGISLDQGLTWSLPPGIQVEGVKSIEEGGGRMVAIGFREPTGLPVESFSAVSLDNGQTWAIKQQTGLAVEWSQLIYDGQKFVAFGSGKRWTSVDGVNWDGISMVVPGLNPLYFSGPTAYNPATGTYARITSRWGNFYDKQKAYRSADGITWELLPATAFKGGHPIRDMTLGQMDEAYCK
jgi:hypothetical protein